MTRAVEATSAVLSKSTAIEANGTKVERPACRRCVCRQMQRSGRVLDERGALQDDAIVVNGRGLS
jgi:vacuolar-type H+-ATPase subunit B/Vma2